MVTLLQEIDLGVYNKTKIKIKISQINLEEKRINTTCKSSPVKNNVKKINTYSQRLKCWDQGEPSKINKFK